MPQTAMAWPCFSRGLMSSSTACDRGSMAAPKTPWISRNSTSSARLVEMPHSAEATVKPAIETMNTFFWPNRPVIHPVEGVKIAAATMP